MFPDSLGRVGFLTCTMALLSSCLEPRKDTRLLHLLVGERVFANLALIEACELVAGLAAEIFDVDDVPQLGHKFVALSTV